MTDTSQEIEEMQQAFFQSKTQSQRLEMCLEMIDEGRKLVEANVRHSNPDFSEKEIKAEVFNRFYSTDYSPEELQSILDWFKFPK